MYPIHSASKRIVVAGQLVVAPDGRPVLREKTEAETQRRLKNLLADLQVYSPQSIQPPQPQPPQIPIAQGIDAAAQARFSSRGHLTTPSNDLIPTTPTTTSHKRKRTSRIPIAKRIDREAQARFFSRGQLTTPSQEVEQDPQRIAQRDKQVGFGKLTWGYLTYLLLPDTDKANLIPPPNSIEKHSKRGWDKIVRKWRTDLHALDTRDIDLDELKKDPRFPAIKKDIEDTIKLVEKEREETPLLKFIDFNSFFIWAKNRAETRLVWAQNRAETGH